MKIIFLIVLLFYVSCAVFVHQYYESGLPYYDSVGSYWNMFSVMNTVRASGIVEGVRRAGGYPLSWLQSYFALAVAPVLPKTPEAMILLNFLCLGLFQWSMYAFFRNGGFSSRKSYMVALFPLFPYAMVGWEGGLIDMRRDSSYFCLLGAVFFLLWEYLLRPTRKKGIMLGVVTGLAAWSRGNASPYMGIVVFSVYLSWLAMIVRTRSVRHISLLLVPALFFFIVAAPFYYVHAYEIYTKYAFGSWAFGIDRITAVKTYLQSLYFMIFGTGQEMARISMRFLIVSALSFGYAVGTGFVRSDFFGAKRSIKACAISGVCIVAGVMILNALLLGVSPIGGIFPNFPALVGIIAGAGCIASCFRISPKKQLPGYCMPAVQAGLSVALLALNSYRIQHTMPKQQPELKRQAQMAASEIAAIVDGKQVGYLWLDHIHVHDLNFYTAQQGGKPIRAGSLQAPGVDTEMPPNPKKTIEEQQREFAKGVRAREFLVVSGAMQDYANPDGFFFLLMHGKPVIEGLLSDPDIKTVYSFGTNDRMFLVLRNAAFSDR